MLKRVTVAAATAALVAAALVTPAHAGPARSAETGSTARTEYVVLFKAGVTAATAQKAITAAGGSVLKLNQAVGLATVSTTSSRFVAELSVDRAVQGVARNRVVAALPSQRAQQKASAAALAAAQAIEKEGRAGARAVHSSDDDAPAAEPLADLQWDMKQIRADRAHRYETGDRRVLVGIIDTGVDGSHPDIAPNFNASLSRNFTVDIEKDANGNDIDGPCAAEPDQSCNDPADVDENGHGTHVASAIAAPINGLGIAGVAPNVTIVNVRAGQDSGYFFLQPSVDALTYAGDAGIDVVNMSYYIDPWLFNCTDNPADSPADQAEQATIIEATQRALDYAHRKGVTLIAAAGNEAIDYMKTNTDDTSPDFADVPGEAAYSREIPPSCVSMPAEGRHVIAVSSTGISTRKSYYSSYGNGYIDVAAPGGDVYDTPTNTRDISKATLAAYPESLAIANGELNPDGSPAVPYIVRDCEDGTCAYYQYLQGTSMASPRAVGVAALIVSKYGHRDRVRGGLTLNPRAVEAILKGTATKTACPTPRDFTYVRHLPNGNTVTATHTCEGSRSNNGFYGRGIVDALRAVHHSHH